MKQNTENENVTSEAVGMAAAEKLIADHGVTAQWDDMAAQNYAAGIMFVISHYNYIISKLPLRRTIVMFRILFRYIIINGKDNSPFSGVACWKLGFEKSSVWEVIQKYLG